MMIVDLFSHKIHSSGDEWPDKIVELASIFAQFDGEVYDREEIENALRKISPRAAYAPRDPSKFRDEISAYPAYLGLYRLSPSSKGWRIFLSETAKQYLLKEEPDVGSFMRLQLSIFQYPNGMGAVYTKNTNKVRIQANTRDRTLDMISRGIHLSPLRLIVSGLLADSKIRAVSLLEATLKYKEIFALANHPRINISALSKAKTVERALTDFRDGKIKAPSTFESRFHILKHTELFEMHPKSLKFRQSVNEADAADLFNKIVAISHINNQYSGFDNARTGTDLERAIAAGSWGEYFDGITTLKGEIINALAADIVTTPLSIPPKAEIEKGRELIPKVYALTARKEYVTSSIVSTRQTELADPEITKIKRQRRNLHHKLLVDKMLEYLLNLGAQPLDNPHIDLYAKIPHDGAFLFEMKSGGENLLDQVRKGISQLYEYRFRYGEVIGSDTTLCLVVPNEPKEIPWLTAYLCKDRGICICWFDDHNRLSYPELCRERLELIAG